MHLKKIFIYSFLLSLPLLTCGQPQIGVKAGYIYYWFTQPVDDRYPGAVDYNYTHSAYSIAVSIRQRSLNMFNHGLEMEYTNRSFGVKSSEPGLGSGGNVDYYYTPGNIYLCFEPQSVEKGQGGE